jgi:hypothetical protein
MGNAALSGPVIAANAPRRSSENADPSRSFLQHIEPDIDGSASEARFAIGEVIVPQTLKSD